MDYILLLTISSSLVSVIGFLVSVFKDFKWGTSFLCVISAKIFTCTSIYLRKLETRIERTENIQCAALKLVAIEIQDSHRRNSCKRHYISWKPTRI